MAGWKSVRVEETNFTCLFRSVCYQLIYMALTHSKKFKESQAKIQRSFVYKLGKSSSKQTVKFISSTLML